LLADVRKVKVSVRASPAAPAGVAPASTRTLPAVRRSVYRVSKNFERTSPLASVTNVSG
jgi:hypothetical protein